MSTGVGGPSHALPSLGMVLTEQGRLTGVCWEGLGAGDLTGRADLSLFVLRKRGLRRNLDLCNLEG